MFSERFSKKLPRDIQTGALRKLLLIDAAENENDLRNPPANHLERLKGTRKNEFSIRINKQWRVCFRFEDGQAYEVGIEDYH